MREKKLIKAACPTCGHERLVMNGRWLREQREAADLTLREVARRLGVSAAYLSDVERGNRRCRIAFAVKFTDALRNVRAVMVSR